MFKIYKDQVIQITRGDSSGEFSMFINRGTKLHPMKHEFSPRINGICTHDLEFELTETKWRLKIKNSGTYSFYYLNGKWYFNNGIVNLADYGISLVKGIPINEDTITIFYHHYIEELMFYIYYPNQINDRFLVRKTFKTDGSVITDYGFPKESKFKMGHKFWDSNNNFVFYLDDDDTECLEQGEYHYQIVAKLYDKDTNSYFKNTITHRQQFIITDDDFDREW